MDEVPTTCSWRQEAQVQRCLINDTSGGRWSRAIIVCANSEVCAQLRVGAGAGPRRLADSINMTRAPTPAGAQRRLFGERFRCGAGADPGTGLVVRRDED